MSEAEVSKQGWISPLIFTLAFIGGIVAVGIYSEVGREVLSKAVMFVVGVISTPFILETTFALLGLFIVIGINQWRMEKEGDGWVYMAVTVPDAASAAEGTSAPLHRLDTSVLAEKPDLAEDLEARLSVAEGYLELGLAREALDQLALLGAAEQSTERVRKIRTTAESLLA